MYYMIGVTEADLVDDKQPYGTPLFFKYGLKRTPAKEKKLKPVNHICASTATCQIVHICPDKIGLKLADMLSDMIKKLIPNVEHRPLHGFSLTVGIWNWPKSKM